MNNIFQSARKSFIYTYHKRKKWSFPPNMTHTTGYNVVRGIHEPEVGEAITSILSKDNTFIDVGANVGYFAQLASPIVGKEGKVHSMEPEPANYYSLVQNTRQYDNVVPFHLALSDEIKILELHHSSHSSCHSTVQTENYLTDKSSLIPSATLDFLWTHYLNKSDIDLLKVDVEGAELQVLRGAEQVFSHRAVKTMIIEYCPHIMLNAGNELEEFYDHLKLQFDIRIIESNHQVTKNGHIQTLQDFKDLSNHLLNFEGAENSNLLCTIV